MSLGKSMTRMHTLVFWTLPEGHVKSSHALPHCGRFVIGFLNAADTYSDGTSLSTLSRTGSNVAFVRGAEVWQSV